MAEEKPFILFLNIDYAISIGISANFVFTQYPEVIEKTKILEDGFLIKNNWSTYSNCKCDNFISTHTSHRIPYSKIVNVESLPPEIDDTNHCLIIGYCCNAFPQRFAARIKIE